MAELYGADNVLITNRVTAVIPDYEIREVKNELLGGSYYEIQTIGQPKRICYATLIVTSAAAKNAIDIAKVVKSPVKITSDGTYYTGIIDGAPAWSRLAPNIHQTTIKLNVSAEGAA